MIIHWGYIAFTSLYFGVLELNFYLETGKMNTLIIHWVYINFKCLFSDLSVLKFVINIAISFNIEFTLNIHWWYTDDSLNFLNANQFYLQKNTWIIHWKNIVNKFKIGRWNRIAMYFQCTSMYLQCIGNVVSNNVNSMCKQCKCNAYSMQNQCIFNAYAMHFQCKLNVYIMYILCT